MIKVLITDTQNRAEHNADNIYNDIDFDNNIIMVPIIMIYRLMYGFE